jgi:hypothetical protein
VGAGHDISDLPAAAQHCDLSYNNTAIRRGRAVVFDWEDFGRVTIPGFDLAIFMGSLFNHDAAVWRRLRDDARRGWACDLIDRVAPEIGIGRDRFFALLPLYYLLFLRIKSESGYGDRIRGKVVGFLRNYLDVT